MGTKDPMIEGTTLSFSCSLGQTLIGPNVTVCTDNGEWKPDTKQVQCVKGLLIKMVIWPSFTYRIARNFHGVKLSWMDFQ